MTHELRDGARVLIVRLSALGDILFALETVAALAAARPDVRIEFLVEDRFANLLRGHPQLARVLVYPRRHKSRWLRFVRELRRHRYDCVIDLHGIQKSALQVLLCRTDLRIGFAPPAAREFSHLAYRRSVTLPTPLPHRADRGYALLRELGVDAQPTAPVLPPPDVEVAAAAARFWPSAAGESGRPRVVLHPGASAFAAFKRWPAASHAELAARLLARGHAVAISFGPGEHELAQSILRAAPGAGALDGTTLGLLGLARVLGDADVVVAADTGPLHIAAAAGARVVALFGPKDPSLYGPRGVGHRVLFHDVPCRPCRRRTCVSPQCILGLTIDTVETAVLELLHDLAPAR